MIPASIRLRLTLWYVLILAVILAGFIGGVYMVLRQTLHGNLDESTENLADAVLSTVRFVDDRPLVGEKTAPPTSEDAEQYTRLFDASRQITFDTSAGMGVVPLDEAVLARALAGATVIRRFDVEGDPVRATVFPILRGDRVVGAIEVGQAADDVTDTLRTLLLTMGIAYPLTLAVAVLGGVFLAGRALSPVDRITRMARHISADHLDQRLDLQLPDDEVGRLARTFDEMIARLDDSFQRQRRFTADASHELRTPLTIMKGQLDVALQREREPQDYQQVLTAVNEEVDRLIRLAGDLLTLSRADAGEIPLVLETVRVAGLVEGAIEQVRPATAQKGIELTLQPGADITINADEDMLLQLLLNLLDNASKYTPTGGSISAGWNLDNNRTELWVRDDGIGIPSEHIPFVFDRFYRVDKARSRSEGGVGLGLAISRWIAEAHGGSIRVDSSPGNGSTFTVLLPTDV